MEELVAIEKFNKLKEEAAERGYPWHESSEPDLITKIMVGVAMLYYIYLALCLILLIIFGVFIVFVFCGILRGNRILSCFIMVMRLWTMIQAFFVNMWILGQ